MTNAIIDRGRGPEIAGTRITVYDVIAETEAGSTPEEIAALFLLTLDEVQTALGYIAEHSEEVMHDYREIEERHARGNPPEVQARIDAARAKYAPQWEEIRRRAKARVNGDARAAGGH